MIAETILSLMVAIRAVESSNGLDPNAHGNDYQITSVCIRDVNRIYGTRYVWPKDARNRKKAENIVMCYLTYYGKLYEKEHGEIPSREILARIYNRGYKGAMRGEGKQYARKIQTVSKRNQFKSTRKK